MRNGIDSVLGKGIIKEIKRAHVVESQNSLCVVGKQTGFFRAQCKQAQKCSWEPGPGHTMATEEHKALLKSQQSRGEGEGGHQKHSTAVTEICTSENTGRRQFEAIVRKVLKKGRHNSKKQIKETKLHEIVFYSLSEMPKFALK